MKLHTIFTVVTLPLLLLVGCGSSSNNNTSDSSNSIPDTSTSTPSSNASASIDVLVLYDKNVQSSYSNVSTRINHLFAVTNNIYRDSQVNIKVNAKKILFFDATVYPALDEIANSASVQALRAQYKADTVLLYQVNPDGEFGLCGTAYGASSYAQVSHFKDAMFAQVAINCPTDSTAHELGHNMGLLHSHKQDGDNAAPFPYGLGHGIDGRFATVMAYTHNFSTNNQVAKFSSPAYECIPGYPCGIPIGQEGEAHATKVLEFTAPKIANLY
jgi:uncharacterized protein YcfL